METRQTSDAANRPSREQQQQTDRELLEARCRAAEAELAHSISQEEFDRRMAAMQTEWEARAMCKQELLESEHVAEVAALQQSINHLNSVLNTMLAHEDTQLSRPGMSSEQSTEQPAACNAELRADVGCYTAELKDGGSLMQQHAASEEQLQGLPDSQAAEHHRQLAALRLDLSQRDALVEELQDRLNDLEQQLAEAQADRDRLADVDAQHLQSVAELEQEVQALTAVAEGRAKVIGSMSAQLHSQRQQLDLQRRQALIAAQAEHSQALESLQAEHGLEMARLDANREVDREQAQRVEAALRAELERAHAALAEAAADVGDHDAAAPVTSLPARAARAQPGVLCETDENCQQLCSSRAEPASAHERGKSEQVELLEGHRGGAMHEHAADTILQHQMLLMLCLSIFSWRRHLGAYQSQGIPAGPSSSIGGNDHAQAASAAAVDGPDAACHISILTSSRAAQQSGSGPKDGLEDAMREEMLALRAGHEAALREVQETLDDKHAALIADIKQRHQVELYQLAAKQKEDLATLQHSMSVQHQQELAKTTNSHCQELQALTEDLNASHQQELSGVMISTECERSDLRDTLEMHHRQQLQKLVANHQQEVLRVRETLKRDHEQQTRSLELQLHEEIERLQRRHGADLAAVLERQIEDGISQGRRLRAAHRDDIQRLAAQLAEQEATVQRLEQESRARLESALCEAKASLEAVHEAALEAQMDRITAQQEADMQQVEVRHKSELAELAIQHRTTMADCRGGNDQVLAESRECHQLDVDELHSPHARQMDEVRAAHAAEMMACHAELAQRRGAWDTSMEEVVAANARLENACAAHEEELAACKAEHDREVKQLHDMIEQQSRECGSQQPHPLTGKQSLLMLSLS
jgi:hypothetical protein